MVEQVIKSLTVLEIRFANKRLDFAIQDHSLKDYAGRDDPDRVVP